jgi:hypothetical protein
MTTWEYEVVRMDTFDLFKGHVELLGNDGWEMVNAQYAIHAAETFERGPQDVRGSGKETIPPRPVWIAFFKRQVEH